MIVLIPAYEPGPRLLHLLGDLRAAAPDMRILIVDDGSGPAYRRVFDAAGAGGCTVLVHRTNRGKGAALRTGFHHAAQHHPGEDVVCADSDGQHSVVDILRVADRVRGGDAVLLGARQFAGEVPRRSRFGNAATRLLFRLATGRGLQDTQTGLRGYPAALLPWLQSVSGDRFEYELEVLLQAARRGIPITELEIATIYLEGNASSHFRPLVDSARVYAPLLAFLASSLAAFLVDLGAVLTLSALTGSLVVSVVAARLLSGGANFLVNRRVVFAGAAQRPGARAAAIRYVLLAGALLTANYAGLHSLTDAGLALLPAKLLTETGLVAASYLAQRSLVFGTPATSAERDPAVAAEAFPSSTGRPVRRG